MQDYGALSAGKTLGTAAIQKAVDACNPVGTYLVVNIVLKPNVNLHLKTWVKVWFKNQLASLPAATFCTGMSADNAFSQ